MTSIEARPLLPTRDLLVVLGITLLVSALGAGLELSERLVHWSRPYETWQIDELPLALLALAFGCAWFAYRRWRESLAEIAVRKRAEERIAQVLEQNRLLARQLLTLQETERRTLARELHDELGQLCNAVKVDAVSITRRGHGDLAAIHASARAITAAADQIHDAIRSLLLRLRPRALDDLGLLAALQDHIEAWESRHGVSCLFVPEGRLDDLGEALNITLYRIVQECLNNVARHAAAQHVTVRLARDTRGARFVRLRIEDDGRGTARTGSAEGLGLAGMKERLSALGGTFSFASRPGAGVRVDVAVPLET